MHLFRLRYRLGDKNVTAKALKNLFNDYSADSERLLILYQLLAYYLFVEENLQNACKYTDQIMDFGDIGDLYLVSNFLRYVREFFIVKSRLIQKNNTYI